MLPEPVKEFLRADAESLGCCRDRHFLAAGRHVLGEFHFGRIRLSLRDELSVLVGQIGSEAQRFRVGLRDRECRLGGLRLALALDEIEARFLALGVALYHAKLLRHTDRDCVFLLWAAVGVFPGIGNNNKINTFDESELLYAVNDP